MPELITLKDIEITVVRKDIKNMYLRVHPPVGDVQISAPQDIDSEVVRLFAISKLPWIRKQRQKIQSQARESPREYIGRESHYLWGERYLLEVVELDRSPVVTLKQNTIQLQVRPGTTTEQRDKLFSQWHLQLLKEAIPLLLEKWEPIMGVKVNRFFVQRMKTKWGSCNISKGTIRLNTELAKKPKHCLEYVVVHEMNHFLEAKHGRKFEALMDRYLPEWRYSQAVLNELPIT